MQILLVNAYEETKRGEHAYAFIKRLIESTYQEQDQHITDNYYVERRLNELSDIVVDWEHDQLHHEARAFCRRFDSFDMVIVVGDMSIKPWEPIASQVVSLIHMVKFTKKPFIATGFGAFSAVYALATRGTRFHVLNGPNGDTVEHLPAYGTYSTGHGTFPAAWLDQETGDLYTYRKQDGHWKPIANIGMHFVASSGKPTSDRFVQRAAYDSQLHGVNPSLAPSAALGSVEADEDLVMIQKAFFQSHFMEKLPASRSFTVKLHKDWYLNRNGSLPTQENLFILGEGKKGSQFLVKDNMLLLACRMEKYLNVRYCKQLISNHIKHIISLAMHKPDGKIESNLHDFLFGQNGVGDGEYDTTIVRMHYSPALSKQAVPSVLPEGPVKVDPPIMSMFYRPPKLIGVDYVALATKQRCSTVGKKPKITVQNPMSARRKRLENAMQDLGIKDPGATLKKIEKTINPYELEASMPEHQKDLLAGIVMKDNSVTVRREHVMRRISYLARNPPAEKRLNSAQDPNQTIKEEDEEDANNEEGEEVEEYYYEDGEEYEQEQGQEKDGEEEKLAIRPFSEATTDPPTSADNMHPSLNNHTQVGVTFNTKGVPAISDWMKVFEQSEQKGIRGNSPRKINQSLTERIIRDEESSRNPSLQPKQPHSARSSTSSKRSHQTPRSARHIVQNVVQSYLPVSHPDATSFILSPKKKKNQDDSDDETDSLAETSSFVKKEEEVPEVVILPSAITATSKSNYKHIVKKIEQKKPENYQSYYNQPYMIPQQMRLKEENESKKKNIAGTFKTLFSTEKTALPLGKIGYIAPYGPFPKAPGSGVPSNVPASAWEYIRKINTPDEWVAGSWK